VDRAIAYGDEHDVPTDDRMTITMDVIATHANGCPLDLDRLLHADDSNFIHDVFGIRRHINRTNGQLEDCFLPRFALSENP
jgi:hypothetical protein